MKTLFFSIKEIGRGNLLRGVYTQLFHTQCFCVSTIWSLVGVNTFGIIVTVCAIAWRTYRRMLTNTAIYCI